MAFFVPRFLAEPDSQNLAVRAVGGETACSVIHQCLIYVKERGGNVWNLSLLVGHISFSLFALVGLFLPPRIRRCVS